MYLKRFLVSLVVLHITGQSLTQEFTTTPKNTFVKVGDSVVFESEFDTAVIVPTWSLIKNGIVSTISTAGNIESNFVGIYEIEDTTNLKLLSAVLENAHQYRCVEILSATQFTAQLIVLKSDPVCTGPSSQIFIEGESIVYQCQIEFSGIWSPQMMWEGTIQGAIIGDDSASTDTVTNSIITVTATPEGNGEEFSCLTNFGDSLDPAPGIYEADNPIEYSNTQQLGPVTIHYAPRNTAIVDQDGSPVVESIYPGDVLSCTSQSNPDVSEFAWMLTKGDDMEQVGSSASVTVSEDWLGDVTLVCTVKNMMGENGDVIGEHSVEETFSVLSNTDPEETLTTDEPLSTFHHSTTITASASSSSASTWKVGVEIFISTTAIVLNLSLQISTGTFIGY